MKRITAILAGAALIASSAAVAVAKTNTVNWRQKVEVVKRSAAVPTNYGSGTLGDWTGYSHGVDGNPATADVLVVGDSIVNRCRGYLRLRLADQGLTSVFDYWSSRPTADYPTVTATPGAVTRTLSYSRLYQPGTFKAVAMLTGTNDFAQPPAMVEQVQRMRGIDAPLVWGTVYLGRSATLTADVRNTGWINAAIYGSGVKVSDWFGFLASYPSYRIGAYLDDGVHPTFKTPASEGDGTGCDAWAAIAAAAIAQVAR